MISDFHSRVVQELARHDPFDWRQRKVVQIRLLNLELCRARTSYQIVIPYEILEKATEQGLQNSPQASVRRGESQLVPVIVASMPKEILINFSIVDNSNKPVVLVTRHHGSGLSFAVRARILMAHLEKQRRIDLYSSHHHVIRSVIYLGPRDLRESLYRNKIEPVPILPENDFVENSVGFLVNILRNRIPRQIIKQSCDRIQAIHGPISKLTDRLAQGRYKNSATLHHPVCNPLMTALDYLKLVDRDGDSQALLEDFFNDCHAFVTALSEASDTELKQVFGVINQFVDKYNCYAMVRCIPDEPFLLKMEHVIPVEHRRQMKSFRQGYPVVIGDCRTVHIEIESPRPAEFDQIPEGTEIWIEGSNLNSSDVFGYSASATRLRQHLYTTKRPKEVGRVLANTMNEDCQGEVRVQNGNDQIIEQVYEVIISARYKIETSLWLTYFVATTLTIILTTWFIIITYLEIESWLGSNEGTLANGESQNSADLPWFPRTTFIVPIIVAVWALFARLRPQEPVVQEKVKLFLAIPIVCAFIVLLVLVIRLSVPIWSEIFVFAAWVFCEAFESIIFILSSLS